MTNKTSLRKSYVDGSYGQVHVLTGGETHGPNPPLYLLHATAYSGRTFIPLMKKLALSRLVLAPDTPGYGASDKPSECPDLSGYADAFVDLILRTGGANGGPIDVLGFHTGVFIALEAAVRRPDLIRSITLIGVPHFVGAQREERKAVLAHRTELTEEFGQFRDRWAYFIRDRTSGLSLSRAFECFVDELRAYPEQWWAHDALFTHDTTTCLEQVGCPVLILNPDTPLAEPSRMAAQLLKRAELIEMPSLSGAIFDLGPDLIHEKMVQFLDSIDA